MLFTVNPGWQGSNRCAAGCGRTLRPGLQKQYYYQQQAIAGQTDEPWKISVENALELMKIINGCR
jgi:hypothetical protein